MREELAFAYALYKRQAEIFVVTRRPGCISGSGATIRTPSTPSCGGGGR